MTNVATLRRSLTPTALTLAALAWSVTIAVLCLWPHPHVTALPKVPQLDKLVHASVFVVEAMLLCAARLRTRSWIAIGFTLAAATEIAQASFPRLGRTGDVADLAADLVGLALG